MKRMASANIILVMTSIAVGLGAGGFMLGYPSVLVGNLEAQVAETGTPSNAKMLHGYVERQYVDDAMNWSPFQTAFELGATTSPAVKQWTEDTIPDRKAMKTAFETRAEQDFISDHIGSETVEQGCSMSGGAINYTVLQPYRVTDGTEGLNLSVHTETPTTVGCETETGETQIVMQPELFNVSHRDRFFYAYNLTHNMTHDPGFRFRVEGAAMNVSKLLQIETDVEDQNCEPNHRHTGNADGSEPYNDGPDCDTDADDFDTPESALAASIDNAENKYEDAVQDDLQRYVEAYARDRYDIPANWVPSQWEPVAFGDVTIDVEVVELEYRVFNLRGRDAGSTDVYRDRYVSACTESHPDDVPGDGSYIHITCGSSEYVSEGSCSCDFSGQSCADCCTSCDEDCNEVCDEGQTDWAGGNPDIDLGCSAAVDCDAGEDDISPSCSCSSVSGCSCPSYFPLNENPPFSVDDGESEDYGMDCPGEKTPASGGRTSSCELDDACNVDTSAFDPSGDTTSGDERSWPDEHGDFVRCTNQNELFAGMDNPWYIQTSDSYGDAVPGPGEPDWDAGTFTARTFPVAAFRSGPTVREAAAPTTAPLHTVRRGFIHGWWSPPIGGGGGGSSGGGGGGDDDEDEDVCTASCEISDTCEYGNTCYCSVTSSEETRYDTADENEVVQTTAEYRFDLKAYVRLKITVTDNRYRIPTADGRQPLTFSVFYDQHAIATADEDGTDSVSMCELGTTPINPDVRHTVP